MCWAGSDERAAFGEIYAEADPDAARARYEELGAHNDALSGSQDAFNRRDWKAFAEFLADDFRQEDRRGLGAEPVTTRDDFVAALRAITDAVPDVRLTVDAATIDGTRNVHRQRWSGHAADGGGRSSSRCGASARWRTAS